MAAKSQSVPTTEQMTSLLRTAGVLDVGRVHCVSVLGEVFKQRSRTIRLQLDHDRPRTDTPASIILKTGRLDEEGRPAYANKREVAFYREVAPMLPSGLVPRCFASLDATDTTVWQIALEDLTDTHRQASTHPLPPSVTDCEAIACVWAAFHATWWGEKRFGVSDALASLTTEASSQSRAAAAFARFVDRFPDLLSPGRRWLFERLLEKLPVLLLGAETGPLTLTHGDAHWWNCLVPRPGKSEGVRLLDWEDWGVGRAATDLAYMMAMLWFPDLRHRVERPLLQRYHTALLAEDVTGYDFDALERDYRSAVLLLMLRPVLQAAGAIPPRVWWPNLERIMLAVDDWGCEDLLD